MHAQNGRHGPPPAKRAKGNPTITRYPPPPGYRPPVQPGVPSAPPAAWQSHSYGPAHAGFQHPPYQPQFPVYPTPQHTPTNGYPPNSHFATQQPNWPHAATTPQGAPPPPASRRLSPNSVPPNARRHNSAPFAGPQQPVLDGNGDPLPLEDLLPKHVTELEAEFDEECYFGRYPDEINPDLSLGSIVWKAALPAKRALPGTFNEVELQALAPRLEEPHSYESVSEYFSGSRRDDAFRSVRQTDHWAEMKDDLIFREFPPVCMKVVSLQEMLARWKWRSDPLWAERPPTSELSRPASRATVAASQTRQSHGGILDDLEAALHTNHRASLPPEQRRPHSRASSASSHHSRAASVHSHHRRPSSTASNHRALPPIRDRGQEDILAALGVTGSPKLVYETPGPAFGPRPTSAAGSDRSKHSRTSSFNSAHGTGHKPRHLEYILEVATNEHAEPDDMATPRPKQPFGIDMSRKRSYAGAGPGAHGASDEMDTPRGKHARRP